MDSCARLPRKAFKVEFGRVRAKSSTSPFQPPPRRLFIVKLPVVTGTRCRTLSVVAVVVFIFTFDKQRLPHARNALYHNAGGGGYSHTLPIRVCAAQRGRDFEAPDHDLERGIIFRAHESSSTPGDYEEAFI